ncbi:MAG: B12-binding domain-containing radical SAM protein [Deltaproteobacteria bacterium]|nr:B12-binding domain-containing radical SAM protein [Deltaproteobacteria bacterium]MBW2154165.1 B12-binding domain-containing radical SAM protein [Deltaproteobacteria bacterium]
MGGCFENICLIKAPMLFDLPHAQDTSDFTEICYLAAMVEPYVNSVSIPVHFYSGKPYEVYVKFLKEHPVDLVGISSMTGAFNNAIRLAKIAKEHDKYVVMGGYHPSALPDDVLKSPYVDAVIIGEGELTFKDLVANGPGKHVPGMAYKENGNIVYTGFRPLIADLDLIPHPLRSARPRRFGEKGTEYSIDTVFTSRGCPWQCSFCANDVINKKWRARSPENVLEELSQLHDPDKKKLIKIWDANFMTDINRVEKICDLMLEHDLTNFKIWMETRIADIVRGERIMDKLYRVGLRHVSLGIESPNEETLKLMKKKNTIDDCFKAVEILKRHGIKAQGYFIIGHYRETKEDTERYPEFADALGLRHGIFMVMTPYPGTAIFEEFKQENKIKSYDWDNYNNFGTVVETRGMDLQTLKKMYAWCYGKFYTKFAFMHQRKPLGMAIDLNQLLFLLYGVFSMDKSTSRSEIKDRFFDALEAGYIRYEKPLPTKKKIPFTLRFFKKVTLRFTHSPGRNIDFCITLKKNAIHVEGKQTDGSEKINGYTFELEKILKLSETIHSRQSMIASTFEILKNNPHKKLDYLLPLIFSRGFLIPLYSIVRCFLPIIVKGSLSLASGAVTSSWSR